MADSSWLDPVASRRHALDLLDELAAREPVELPVLSLYLDTRPSQDQAHPARRASAVIARDRLAEVREGIPAHGSAAASIDADLPRIHAAVDEVPDGLRGLAIFACAGSRLWATCEAALPFRPAVESGPLPRLWQLAGFVAPPLAVAVVADTNSARFFTAGPGRVHEIGALDEDPFDTKKTDLAASRANDQARVERNREGFVDRVVERLGAEAGRVEAGALVLAADDVTLPRLESALTFDLGRLPRTTARVRVDADQGAIEGAILPALEALWDRTARDLAATAADAARSGGEGALGAAATRSALEIGQVRTLLLGGDLDAATADALVRDAVRTAASVVVVPDQPDLTTADGIGAVLRFVR